MTEVPKEELWQPSCPADNGCVITNPLDPECGADPHHLPPLEPVEAICPFALQGLREQLEERRQSIGNQLALGWVALELGVIADDDTDAEGFFSNAGDSFRATVERGNEHNLLYALRAWHAMHYIDAFRERRLTGTVAEKTIQARYAELGKELFVATSAENMSKTLTTGEVSGVVSEFLLAGLLMRTMQTDLFPYPASSREENQILNVSVARKRQSEYHDYYLLSPQKTPLQIKWQLNEKDMRLGPFYDESIQVIYVKHLIDTVKRIMGISNVNCKTLSHRIADKMTAEANGQLLNKKSARLLEIASQTAIRAVYGATES